MSAIDSRPPPVARVGNPGRDLGFRFAPRYRVVWVALAALIILCAATASEVFRTNSLTLVTALAGVLAIASAGQLLVIMSGGIDLSIPAVMTFAAAIIVHQTQGANGRLAGAVLETIAIVAAVGVTNGLLVAVVRLNAMIVTLAMNGVVTGVLLLWIGTTYSQSGQVPSNLSELTGRNAGFVNLVAIIALALILLLAAVLRWTSVGRSYVAAGTNRVAAEIIGIRVVFYQLGGYILDAILAGIAGILLSGLLTTPDSTIGDTYLLTTIIAVALGGAALSGGPASLLCTMGGCVFEALLQQYLQAQSYSAGVSQLVNGFVLIIAVALVTAGFAGRIRRVAARLTARRRGLAREV